MPVQSVAGQLVVGTVLLGSATGGMRVYSFRIEPYFTGIRSSVSFPGMPVTMSDIHGGTF